MQFLTGEYNQIFNMKLYLKGRLSLKIRKIIKGAPQHPLLKPKIMKKQMDYFFNLMFIVKY